MSDLRATHIPAAGLEPYTPPRHTGTINHLLLGGEVAGGAVSVVHGLIEHGGEAQPHYHRRSAQFLHILAGECLVTVGPDVLKLGRGDSVHIPVNLTHRVEVLSADALELINVYHPALAPDDTIE